MMDTQPDNAVNARTPTHNPWLALLSVVVPVLIGVGAGIYLLKNWYIPKFGMGVHQRTVNLGQQLFGKQLPANSILCLGNSVVREGLDTQIALDQWPRAVAKDWQMYNVSLSGCTTLEQRVILPRMLACQPRVIVLELGIAEIGRSEAIHPDKSYAYALAGFGQNIKDDAQLLSIASFSKENRQQLFSSEAEQLLHFRNLPLTSMNENLRRVAQPEYLLEGDTNWVNPFEMAFDYTPDRLQRHLEDLKNDHRVVLNPALRAGKTLIRQNLELIQKSGCRPMLVLLPIHPALHDFYFDVDRQNIHREFFDFIRELEKQYQIATWDATKLLSATQFSDALHPNAEGRRSYSTGLGKWLNQELIPAQESRPTE